MPAPKDAGVPPSLANYKVLSGFARWTAQPPSARRLALTPYTRVTR